MRDRRNFLRDLVSLPLIGGGTVLIGAPSAPVPLVQAAALPALGGPRERARYAWAAFTSAMDEVAAGLDGWTVRGGSRITPVPHYGLTAQSWGSLDGVRYAYEDRPGYPLGPYVSEHGSDLGLTL